VDVTEAFRLDGKVAVVIGGTGVLCSVMAEALAGAGAGVVVVGRDAHRGQAVVERIGRVGEARFEPCDVTRRGEIGALVHRVDGWRGRIDILVNGAAANASTPFLDISDDEIERIVGINQVAVMRSCQEFGRYFVDRAESSGDGASIINMGSMAGLVPLSKVFTYSMTKAAVHNLSKNLAREWGPLGVRCNTLVPGFFPAEQNRTVLTHDRVRAIMDHTPMGRFGAEDDLIGATLLLASPAGRFITGAEIVVDGGFSAMAI